MTSVVIDPRLRPARRFPLARAEARWRFRLAMTLFFVATTVTLHSSSQSERAKHDADFLAAKGVVPLVGEPHCDATAEPDPRSDASGRRPEPFDPALENAARVEDVERFRVEAESGRARADCLIPER